MTNEPMKPTKHPYARRAARPQTTATALVATAALSAMLATSAAADMYQLSPMPGGVPAQSTITSVTPQGTNTTVCWYGMQGWYSVEMSTNSAPPWTSVGRTAASDYAWCLTVPNGGNPSAFFRLNQYNAYVGSGGCAGCHGDKYNEWVGTRHSSALDSLAKIGMDKNPSCIVCHTVGFGQTTGYTDNTNTAHLSNVGCENCHGPAGGHKYSDHDIIHPAVSYAAEICGGCHDGDMHPTYTEWTNSAHSVVVPDVANGSSGFTNVLNGPGRQMSCGPCHSGATRLAMLANYEDRMAGRTNALTLPSGHDAAAYGQTCVVCHDPHSSPYQVTNIVSTASGFTTNIVATPHQLRNPMRSTNYFTFFTGTATNVVSYTNFAGAITRVTNWLNDNFVSQYDPNIQICAQCHNSRGARWDGIGRTWNGKTFVPSTASWSRGPHPTAQYNILIGIVQPDYLNTNSSGIATNYVARHGVGVSSRNGNFNTNQCATCHVPIYQNSNTLAHITGHTFAMDTNGCALGGCHTGGVPDIEEFQTTTTNSIAAVIALLNQWATNRGPTLFGTNYPNYLQNSWEFGTPGALASITNAGPSSSDQKKLPDAIKQARFNLYMVQGDGSLGVHNPNYVPFLISDAQNKVLNDFKLANFKAYTTASITNQGVGFTNLCIGVTNWNWDFGNGNTSTSATPTNFYASAGVYTVSLTATGPSGSESLVRNSYIAVTNAPAADFVAAPTGGPPPLTVYFTNLSANATAYAWTFGDGKTSTSTSPFNVYTNAGSYTVTLKARNLGVTNTLTRTDYITVGP